MAFERSPRRPARLSTSLARLCLLLGLAAWAPSARADEPPAPPTGTPLGAPVLLPVPAAPPAEVAPIAPLRLAGYELLAGAGAAVVAVPATMALGSWLGTQSPNLVASLVPGVLLFLVVPPLAVTGAEWLVGRRLAPDRARFHPAIWAGVGASALGLVVGSLAGVWTGDALSLSLFTLAEALVMPAAVTAVLHFRRPRPPAPAAAPASTGLLLPEPRRAEGIPLPSVSVPLLALSF